MLLGLAIAAAVLAFGERGEHGWLAEDAAERRAGTPAPAPEGRAPEQEILDAGPADPPRDLAEPLCSPFPAAVCAELEAVEWCESRGGADPAAYDLEAENGGRLQLSRSTWAPFFYGRWHWEEIVLSDAVNREAGYVVWQRAGGSFAPWSCGQGGER